MNSDFVFINPNKIPPRRAANSVASGKIKIRKIKSTVYQDQNDVDEMAVPEFNLLGESVSSRDPLTLAIFRSSKTNWKDQSEPFPIQKEYLESAEKSAESSRQAILAELENIDKKDAELVKKFNRVEPPRRDVHPDLVLNREAGPIKNDGLVEIKLNIAPPDWPAAPFDQPEPDQFRVEDDWFRVSLSAPKRIFELKELAKRRRSSLEKIKKDETGLSDENEFKFRTYLAVFFILVVPLSAGVFLFFGKDNFVASAFNSFNAKLLSTSSFTLVNSEESIIFPRLAEINSYLKKSGLDQPAGSVAEFIENNSTFGWLNFFKKKAGSDPAGGYNFNLKSLELLDSAEAVLASSPLAGEDLNQVRDSLKDYVDWLNFWDQLTSPEKNYLIAIYDADQAWPGGGRLESYALVKTETAGLETLGSGKFSALDAALDLKIVPPEPVKLTNTAWLPSQALWFLDFKESAKTLVNFFENTTQKKVDGVVVINKDFLKKLSFKESILFDADSANWFYGLSEALARKPNTRWASLAEYLERGLAAHQVQFYFKDGALEKFTEDSNWLFSAKHNPQDDVLGITMASLDGGSPALELIEYKINVFEDGSVMANLNMMLKQPVGGPGRNYFKIHLAKSAQILKAGGFSQKEKLPQFDYTAEGFSSDARIASGAAAAKGPGGLEIFDESGLTVAGGWVWLESGARNTLSLEYLLPFKLSRKNSSGDYRLKIFRPHQNQNTPFRFMAVSEKGIRLDLLEPNGFVTENLGEYQGNLSEDVELVGTFIFGD